MPVFMLSPATTTRHYQELHQPLGQLGLIAKEQYVGIVSAGDDLDLRRVGGEIPFYS